MQPDLPPEVAEVRDALVSALGDDLSALLWQGSWARGEGTDASDHDMIVILRRAGEDVLATLHNVFEGRSGWSTFVKTEAEIRQYPAGRIQFHFGVQVIHGDFTPPPLTREGVIEELRNHISTVNHEIRYRIVHGAARSYRGMDAEFVRARNANWMYHMSKAALMGIKAREYLISGDYPETRKVLRERITDPLDAEIIDTVDRWPELKSLYAEDITPIALKLDACARRLAAWLEAHEPS